MQKILYLTFFIFIIGCGNSESITNENISSTDNNSQKPWYHPLVDTTWQWQLTGDINTSYNVDLYDIDLFDSNQTLIDSLHEDGRRVICYFSAGSFESWREDALLFPEEVLGKKMDGWDERWLDIRDQRVKKIMLSRLDLAHKKGCDGVEPDNVDGFENDTKFALKSTDQLLYNLFLAKEAHKRGLAVGLKNDLSQIPALVDYFDFALNEECHQFHECADLKPFIVSNKPVFNAEYSKKYKLDKSSVCKESKILGMNTLILPLNLDGSFRIDCL